MEYCAILLEFSSVLSLLSGAPTSDIPVNWREFISPEMLEKYDNKTTVGYSGDFFQGDIAGVDRENTAGMTLNNAISDEKKRWPGGVVPYQFSNKYNKVDRAEKILIQAAMNQILASSGGCIKFVPRKAEENYIFIARGLGCSSQVGRVGGKQLVTLTVGCLDEIGLIQHEFMHALGFYHEHSRADRDDYIIINSKNLPDPMSQDFEVPTDSTTFGLPYDYDSVMHYRHNAFTVDPSFPTIVPKKKGRRIGQSAGLSLLDIYKLRKAYFCEEPEIPPPAIHRKVIHPPPINLTSTKSTDIRAEGDNWKEVSEALERLSGKATQIYARNSNPVTGISLWMVNSQNQLFRWLWRTETWEKERSDVKNVGAGFDGSAWSVTPCGFISRYRDGHWKDVPGLLVQVSGRNYNEALGVNRQEDIYHYIRGGWLKLPGAARWASIGEDGEMWVINSQDQIFRWSATSDNWESVEGAAKMVDVYNADRIVVTNAAHDVFRWTGSGWNKLEGSCEQASITKESIYCVNQAGEITTV